MTHLDLTPVEFEALRTNFSMSPSYSDLFVGLWHASQFHYSLKMHPNKPFTTAFIQDVTGDIHFNREDVCYTLLIAVFFTLIRHVFERYLCVVGVSVLEPHGRADRSFLISAIRSTT